MQRITWDSPQSLSGNPLPDGETHIWKIERSEFPAHCLTQEEWQAAQRFKNEAAKSMYIRSRAALRQLMSHYVGKPLLEFLIQSGQHGKPFCDRENIGFNTTHSRNLLLIAFCRGGELGIDVECGSRLRHPLKLAKHYFSSGEIRHLESLADEKDVLHAFLRYWVCKEAALKSSGHGLAGGLERTQVELTKNTRISRGIDGKELQALEFMPEEGFHGALVGESPIFLENVKWFVLS